MEINIFFAIFLGLLTLFIQYAIIETAVRRGIDASETNSLLEQIKKRIEKIEKDK